MFVKILSLIQNQTSIIEILSLQCLRINKMAKLQNNHWCKLLSQDPVKLESLIR